MAENPKVFISYSHDSPEHKQWVSELAARLRHNGIDAILDQWDLRFGDDIIRFIERGIVDADRVLVICTNKYVNKANTGVGHINYEQMIIKAEMAQNSGTNKIIPIIRQASGKEKTPIFLRTRFYADFTNDSQFDEEFDKLLRELYEVSVIERPHLRESPPPSIKLDMQLVEISEHVASASEAYEIAFKLVRADDVLGWQQLVKRIRPNVFKSLIQWQQNELDEKEPKSKEQLFQVVDKAVEVISPLMSVALMGVESGEEQFKDQKSLLSDLKNIDGWNPTKHIVWGRIPNILAYIYHSLHGCVCLSTSQLDLALDLARVKIPIKETKRYFELWHYYQIQGRALSISDNLSKDKVVKNRLDRWNYLYTAYERWEWLSIIFENELEYRTSLIAYYMALNIHELANSISEDRQASLKSRTFQTIPLPFLFEKWDIISRAISILNRDRKALIELWKCVNVTSQQIQNVWEEWIELSKAALEQFGNQFYNRNLDYYLLNMFLYLFED